MLIYNIIFLILAAISLFFLIIVYTFDPLKWKSGNKEKTQREEKGKKLSLQYLSALVIAPIVGVVLFTMMKATSLEFTVITAMISLIACLLGVPLYKTNSSLIAWILGWIGTGFFLSAVGLVMASYISSGMLSSSSAPVSVFNKILPPIIWSIIIFIPLGIRAWRNSIQHYHKIKEFIEMKEFAEMRESMKESTKEFTEMRESIKEVMESIDLIKGFMETITGKKSSPRRSEKTENSEK